MHGFISPVAGAIAVPEHGHGANGGLIAEDAAGTPRRIFSASQGEEKYGAECNPQWVEQPKAPAHARYHSRAMTRGEIEEKLVNIVRQEKNIPDDRLSADTPLADAGIDSLDALTILFAIEEQFHISIPDDKARGIKTFGDMVSVVQELVVASN
jgi:acyl carrier protein